MPDASEFQHEAVRLPGQETAFRAATVSLPGLWRLLVRRRRLAGSVVGGLLLACLLYCLIAPNQYEARGRVALRQEPETALGASALQAASLLSAPLQLETLAEVLRSERLAWQVILRLQLYQAAGFRGRFASKFPGFHPEAPDAEAREWLLERFARRLDVQSGAHSLIVQIRFRSRDAALSAAVVNALMRAYVEEQNAQRGRATADAAVWLTAQLQELKAAQEREEQSLIAFQNTHGILTAPQTLGIGQTAEVAHSTERVELDELGRQLSAASTERILSEAAYRAASTGDPELVAASSERPELEGGSIALAVLRQIEAHRSALEEERAQLSAEHGPNFPRVVEIGRQLQDLEAQKKAQDMRLVEAFHSAWQRASAEEQAARKQLEERTAAAMNSNQAASEYALRLQEAHAAHEVYLRVLGKTQEAGLLAGVQGSNIVVVDEARTPAKPVAPNLPLYLLITLFLALWLGLAAVLLAETLQTPAARGVLAALAICCGAWQVGAQAPTPTTSGLPSGVAKPTVSEERRITPDRKEAPAVWELPSGAGPAAQSAGMAEAPLPAPIAPGDTVEVSEFHTPEFHSLAQVAADGTVTLPMVKDVRLQGLDEQGAARAIEAALLGQGFLLHPRVSVHVTVYAGQDVSVLGEVARPGVYPYTVHHRLLDLLSAASGLAPSAGRLVNLYHRGDPHSAHPVVLDPTGSDATGEHNPELEPGDTVQVSRAGLVYVIGDVVRPGGFAVDPAQGLTVVQALSLAWGPAQNAATGSALLIREQKGGRTLTPLNLKRMLRGQEPDQPVHDRDILFIPDSTAKNLWNKTLESAIQSVLGVSIYAGLVYSQRF